MVSKHPEGLSLVEATCAVACLEFKGRLGASRLLAGIYTGAAERIQGQIGDEPDIAGDLTTRVHPNPFDHQIILQAVRFAIDNPELITDDLAQAYSHEVGLRLVDEELEAGAGFRQTAVEPAVKRFIGDTVQLLEHL